MSERTKRANGQNICLHLTDLPPLSKQTQFADIDSDHFCSQISLERRIIPLDFTRKAPPLPTKFRAKFRADSLLG